MSARILPMLHRIVPLIAVVAVLLLGSPRPGIADEKADDAAAKSADSGVLVLHARSRVQSAPDAPWEAREETLRWDAGKTAVVVCDMWDQHWCRGASRRVAEMAPHMNRVIAEARHRGVLIIHCPSSCMEPYRDSPMRRLAQQAPAVETKIPLQSWCGLNDDREGKLPIDDSDGGCDCWPRCPQGSPWRREIETIEIHDEDAVTDSAEAYYLMKQRGIENVIVMGVHTNMCVLGRPFSIRQMVYQGQNVVLMRDMTDTMYNPRSAPFVKHTEGTRLVIEHIEEHWCPTVASTDLTDEAPFQFAQAEQPHVVFVIGEGEYKTAETLPVFAKKYLEPLGLRVTIVSADASDGNNFPGLEILKSADLLFLSVRRRSPPQEQLDLVREYIASGRPVVGIRTACHAFHTRGEHPDGHDEWQEFDPEILGGHYTGHHGDGPKTALRVADGAEQHAILRGIDVSGFVGNGSLYQVSPLADDTVPLLFGSIPDTPAEPVAWTRMVGKSRVFFTSLGHPDDFASEEFNHLLANGVLWALGRETTSK